MNLQYRKLSGKRKMMTDGMLEVKKDEVYQKG